MTTIQPYGLMPPRNPYQYPRRTPSPIDELMDAYRTQKNLDKLNELKTKIDDGTASNFEKAIWGWIVAKNTTKNMPTVICNA